jgi:hypothetical protein
MFFGPDTPDEEWLRLVGQKGWTAITHDKGIGRKPNELAALREANVRAFVLASKGSLKGDEITGILMDALPQIFTFVDKFKPPFIAKIYRGGSVKKWR